MCQCKKANASNHGQEMDQGGKTNEKMREVWQVDLEVSQCTAVENGSLGAETLWNSCGGSAANLDQASEDEAAEAAQCGGGGTCPTTTIALLHPNADPAIQIPCNLIRRWLFFWEHNRRLRPKVGKVWAQIATAMMARSLATRWRHVRGRMSAVIVTHSTYILERP